MTKTATERPADARRALYYLRTGRRTPSHEYHSHQGFSRRLAALVGLAFGGECGDEDVPADAAYFVPDDTLVGTEAARRLGITSEQDLFGGLVPFAFVGTKAITHALHQAATTAPTGWVQGMGLQIGDCVLPGFTTFSRADARRAGAQLLQNGVVRLKPVRARAGRGQVVAESLAQLEDAIAALDDSELATYGVVLEENMNRVATFSVGQIRVAGHLASYYGTQRLTRDNTGAEIYGGSDLEMVRGDFDDLLRAPMSAETRHAVMQARSYDAAATACYPEIRASRRNYDVAVGNTATGAKRSGVLEQSWRIGGASSAEILGLELLKDDLSAHGVRACSVECYGEDVSVPDDAVVFYRGEDEEVGHITKYAKAHVHGRTQQGD